MEWMDLINENVRDRYEFHNVDHAVEILYQGYPLLFQEINLALHDFYITHDDLVKAGGNESDIPKRLSSILRPLGWEEVSISGDLHVKIDKRRAEGGKRHRSEAVLEDYISGYNIDYVKEHVAMDMEWNSKDQTFDRDLFAFRTFYECGIISCGVLITRSASLNPIFESLGPEVKRKYGASTTWMGKLLPRLQTRRHGGCPIWVVGITPDTIRNDEENRYVE